MGFYVESLREWNDGGGKTVVRHLLWGAVNSRQAVPHGEYATLPCPL